MRGRGKGVSRSLINKLQQAHSGEIMANLRCGCCVSLLCDIEIIVIIAYNYCFQG